MAPVDVEDDYYEILEVPQTADKAAIRASYRRLALIRHPDRNVGNPNATAEFQLLNVAHATLTDDAKRREYNLFQYPLICHRRRLSNAGARPAGGASGAAETPLAAGPAEFQKQQAEFQEHLNSLLARSIALGVESDTARILQNRARRELRQMDINGEADDQNMAQFMAARSTWRHRLFHKRETAEAVAAWKRRTQQRGISRLLRIVELARIQAVIAQLDAQLKETRDEADATIVRMCTAEHREKERQEAERRRTAAARKSPQEEQRERREAEAQASRARDAEESRRRADLLDAMSKLAAERGFETPEGRAERMRAEREAARRQAEEDSARIAQEAARREAERQQTAAAVREAQKDVRWASQGIQARATRERRERDTAGHGAQPETAYTVRIKIVFEEVEEKVARKNEEKETGAEAREAASCSHQSRWDWVQAAEEPCGRCCRMMAWYGYQCPLCKIIVCVNCRFQEMEKKAGENGQKKFEAEASADLAELERLRKAREAAPCSHQPRWDWVPAVEEPCGRCNRMIAWYGYQCPRCKTVVCVNCQSALKTPSSPSNSSKGQGEAPGTGKR